MCIAICCQRAVKARRMMLAFLVIFAAIAIAIIAWYIHYYRFMNSLPNVRGPTPVPIFGNVFDFGSCDSILPTISNYIDQHGQIVKFMLGIDPVIAIADYGAIQSVLSSTKLLKKASFYRFLHKWLKFGLLTNSDATWKQRRRILTPTYHFQILEQFTPIFDKCSNVLVEQLRKETHKSCVDVHPYISLCALDVICETAMGVPINAQINETSSYVQSVKAMGIIITNRVFKPLQQFDWFFNLIQASKEEKKCLHILHGHTQSVIQSRKKELMTRQDNKNDAQYDVDKKKRVAFLDMLLQCTDEHGAPLSDEAIQEEVDTFMFEGHDTESSAISFALFEIANNPDVQEKILEEQKDILGVENREITLNDLNKMRYLEMVIKETLRMYPAVPFYGRYTTEDIAITPDVTVPAGFTAFIFAFHVHRDEKYFPNPNKFDPDRFLPENNRGLHPYSFVPFSAGPRNCIGQKFAMLEIKMTLTKVVRHFVLSPTVPRHNLNLSAEIVLKSDNGILIQMHERNMNN